MKIKTQYFDLGLMIFALALFFFTRLWQLDLFPPFLDEMIHVFWGERITQTGPLAYAQEGRILTTWLLILFQAHESATVWIARSAVLFSSMIGFAAALGSGRILAGRVGFILAGILFLFSPYHFFFQRLTLSDTTSGSIVLLALYFCLRLSKRENLLDAALVGISLALAVGFKIGVIVYLALPVFAFLCFNRRAWRWLAVSLATAGALIGGFFALLLLRGYNPFHLFISHNQSSASTSLVERFITHALMFAETSAGYWTIPLFVLAILAALYLCWKRQFFLPLAFLLPLAITLLNQRQTSRYWFAAESLLALFIVLAAGYLYARFPRVALAGIAALSLWFIGAWLLFVTPFYTDANQIVLPERDYREYIASDASGYAIQAILDEIPDDADKVIGLLANCHAVRYMAAENLEVLCPVLTLDGRGIDDAEALIAESQANGVYVILEDSPYAPETVDGRLIISISRPGEMANLSLYALSDAP